MMASVSKAIYRATSANGIGAMVAAAAKDAMAYPRRPVSLEIPIDLQYAGCPTEPDQIPPAPAAAVGLDETEVIRAVEIIAGSRRPIVWAGGGVVAAGAIDQVVMLVRRLGAGLLTSPNGRGILPEDDPLCIGNFSWDQDVRALCREADLLVAIGTRFQGPNTENWKMELPARLVHLDVDPAVPGRNYPVEAAIVADAKVSTIALLNALDRIDAPVVLAETGWLERVAAVTESSRRRLRDALGPQVGLLDGLASCLNPDTVVVKDSTISAYTWGNRLLPVRRPRTSIMPNSFAIGLGLPQAVGAAVGSEEPVVLLVGDGGFLLAATELATVAQERLPIVVLVFADGGYGILRNMQDHQYGTNEGRIGVDLGRPDFCSLAKAFGIHAVRVDSIESYTSTVNRALADRQPCVVEVDLDTIGPMTIPFRGVSKPPVLNV
jgi:acetolactate synthase-1/2/3 large subunit